VLRIEAAARLAARLGVPGDPAAVRRCRDKHQTRRALAAAGVPQAASVAVDGLAAATRAATRIGYPVVVKPRALAASFGVSLVHHPGELGAAFELASGRSVPGIPSFGHDGVLVEEYLSGAEVSVDCALHDGVTTVVTVARKRLGYPPYFEEVEHLVDAADPLLADQTVTEVLSAAHTAVGLRDGWAHTELRLTADGPKVVEINARLGGDLIPYLGLLATGVDPGPLAAATVCGRAPVCEPTLRRAAGVRFFYPQRRSVMAAMTVDEGLLPQGVDLVEPLAEPGSWVEPPPGGHVWGRAGYATVVAETAAQCRQRLDALDKAVTLLVR
jgi:biotin carboxylase